MKKLIAGVLIAGAPLLVNAADNTGGCGWGAMLMEGSSGLVPHTTAATTNGSTANQLFGMTSGTGGCDTSKPIGSASLLIDQNVDKVARDMSRGNGEMLDALAAILSIEETDKAHFAVLAKQNFDVLFPSLDVTGTDVVARLLQAMSGDNTLTKYVS